MAAESPGHSDSLMDSAGIFRAPELLKDTATRVAGKKEKHPLKSAETVLRSLLPGKRPLKMDPLGAMVYFVVLKTLNHEYRER